MGKEGVTRISPHLFKVTLKQLFLGRRYFLHSDPLTGWMGHSTIFHIGQQEALPNPPCLIGVLQKSLLEGGNSCSHGSQHGWCNVGADVVIAESEAKVAIGSVSKSMGSCSS